jgi:hypothetical protein
VAKRTTVWRNRLLPSTEYNRPPPDNAEPKGSPVDTLFGKTEAESVGIDLFGVAACQNSMRMQPLLISLADQQEAHQVALEITALRAGDIVGQAALVRALNERVSIMLQRLGSLDSQDCHAGEGACGAIYCSRTGPTG